MKTLISKQVTQLLVGCAALAFGNSAFATSTWSNLAYNSTTGTGCSTSKAGTVASSAGSTISTTVGTVTTSVTNVGDVMGCGSSTEGVSLSVDAFSTSNGPSSTTGTTFATAALRDWGTANGLGVINRNELDATGPHAIDNQYGVDAVRLNFGAAVSLSSIGIGWVGSDTDFSVLAWTGAGTPCTGTGISKVGTVGTSGVVNGTTLTNSACSNSTLGTTGSSLIGTGWSLIGNVSNLAGNGTVNFTTSISSSYWLVSAYSTAFAGGTMLSGTTANLDGVSSTGVYDSFKLLSVAANKTSAASVPEPGSLALVGAGLVGLVASRRRKLATA